ncbi:MAG: 4-hydroxybenzoate octaprenyltransferase [Hyphomicrobiales bacterium]|nr:MAG: 4-hydroxybenzoate octaprenyltransferase [Hyphomicrobiales bacterium]
MKWPIGDELQPKNTISDDKVADAHAQNWSDKWLPAKAKPYTRLMRLDRPVGVWLLLWPCFWGQILALTEVEINGGLYSVTFWAQVKYVILCFTGAIIMRGAGCVYNDLVDYKYDMQVERTKSRPLPAGDVSTGQAKKFLFFLLLAGFLVLIQFNWFTIFVGAASLILVAIYPWMKRFTYWPQAFLGLTFNWGALVGFGAVNGYLSDAALLLYAAGFFWTIGYDTIYAHQDKDDDMMVGLKSTAILFGNRTKLWLAALYALFVTCLTISGLLAGFGLVFLGLMPLLIAQLIWQIYKLDLDDGDLCLKLFQSNIMFGGAVTLVFLICYLLIGIV